MFPIVDNANYFLFGSTLLIMACGVIKIDKYESNSLINLDHHSRLIMSKESVEKAKIKIHNPFKYWLKERIHENKIVSVKKLENSDYEIILSNDQTLPSISWISYKVGKGSVWSEVFK